ncbi:hypothetical protein SKAU_G00389660 [Synaphobranchus kaupii]|uniref:Centromere kinetochore component CENP-T N-terminal domain-containing protein n=1 Tax=Synaphobranchus kaupii TaxID=118154 RepID=A0A9Q1IDG3_SYNKA|nr:hypothetical protein SKAU_G00389660 [Synaphobranchus kaupii]
MCESTKLTTIIGTGATLTCFTMDSFEDVSARVLLRNVMYTEQPRSPVTRSMSRQQSASSRAKMSTRLRKSDVGLLSPQVALRQKLRQNLHKNISNGSPLKTRKSSLSMSTTIGKVKTPAVTSSHSLSEDDITPRGLLRGILRTEPELSLLVPDRPDSEETEPRSTESSLCSNRPSMGISNMSNLELPDLPTVNLTMAVRGISRKRPKRNINLSVFERKIIDQSGDGCGDGEQDATGNLSAMSGASASSLSLSLKTPCVVLHVDRRVLQRNAGKRKAISVEDFEAGVHDLLAKKRNPGREQSLSETAGMEKFTLGLSNATASNASSIAMSNTALYPPPVSTTHAYVAIHDRDTVTASQIQREMEAGGGGVGARTQDEVEEEEMKVEQQQQQQEEEEEEVGGDAYGGARRKSRRTGSRTGVEEGRAGEQGYEEEAEKMEDDMGAVLDEIDDEGPEGSVREGGDDEAVESEREEEEEERDNVFESNMQEEDGENGTTLESDREEGGALESTGTQEGGATESEKQEEEVSSGPEQVRGSGAHLGEGPSLRGGDEDPWNGSRTWLQEPLQRPTADGHR